MKKYFIILFLLITGCETVQLNELSLDTITLIADKELYHSGEVIHLTTNIISPVALENASIRFYGIYSRRYRLDETKKVDLQKGENIVTFDYHAPGCYGCAGISPGTYEICANVMYNREIIANSTVKIEIRQ